MTRDRAELLLQVLAMPEAMLRTFIQTAAWICPDLGKIAAENPKVMALACRNGIEFASDPERAIQVVPHPKGANVISLFQHHDHRAETL